MWRYARSSLSYIGSGIVSGTAAAVFLSWVPSFQAKLVHALIQEPSFPMEILTSFLVYKVVGNVFTGIRVGLVSYAIATTTQEAKSSAIMKTYLMPYDYFIKNSFHDTIELVNNDVETVVESFTALTNYTLRSIIQISFTMYILSKKSIHLMTATMICSVIHIGIQNLFTEIVHMPNIIPIQKHKKYQDDYIRDYIEKMEIYKTHYKETWVFDKWLEHQNIIMKYRIKQSYTFGSLVALNFTSGSFMIGLLILYGKELFNDSETIHEFIVYAMTVFQIFEQSVDVIKDVKGKELKRKKVHEFLDTPVRDDWGFLVNDKPDIYIKNLSFGYHEDNKIISDFNMKIPYGKHVGFHGMSGAGKSTLLKLLMGLYKPWEGEIKWHDVNLRDHDREWFYKYGIAYVPQEPLLFKDEPIVDHYLTADVPRSGPMSGGQKQRAALAYAISREPLVLFLDEPTCHQDQENTDKIIVMLKNFKGTIIAISHDNIFLNRFCDITKQVKRC
jgi:ABC-type multidrug transport system fused ATPase/permease subunit